MLEPSNYKTIKELAGLYKPLFTETGLRQMIHKNTDGISTCVFKIGGKVLINVSKFEQWFQSKEAKEAKEAKEGNH